jgi:hypothetical protein
MKRRELHGLSKHPMYHSWIAMIRRCHASSEPGYKNYGARGIKVCDRWRNSFVAFLADMGGRPSPKHTLDRINNDGNYEPGNCRWATVSEQMQNTRRTRLLEHKGERLSIHAWARKLGLTNQAMHERVKEWPLERALSEPAKARLRPPVLITFRGQRKNISEWARTFGIPKPTMQWRVRKLGARKAMKMAIERRAAP